jgi:hypothetical protein
MEFFELVIKGGIFVLIKRFLPKILPYIGQIIREPLFWVILIGLIIVIIIGNVLERKEKRKLDKKKICQNCKGYGELVIKNKGQKESAICPHCSGTGWTIEG